MEWDAFQEAIRDQYTDEELERFHNEIHRERVMIALPEMQAKANQVVNEIVKHCDETEKRNCEGFTTLRCRCKRFENFNHM